MRIFTASLTVASLVCFAGIAQAVTYQCVGQYEDTAIQDTPLWSETFSADLDAEEPAWVRYGVSPGTDEYYATATKTGDSEFALVIWNNTTEQATVGIYEQGAAKATVVHQTAPKQHLLLSCQLSE